MSNTITNFGTDALNLTNVEGIQPFTPIEDGTYAVTLTNNIACHSGATSLNEVLLFNTAPLETDDPEKWYFTVDVNQGAIISGKVGRPIYAFLVDQSSAANNAGKIDIKFTKINP